MRTNTRGFTLVEVLIIAPIIILMIGAFIGLVVTLTGETLVLREKNVASYDVQAALDEIETSIIQSTEFLSTTATTAEPTLPSPQGKGSTATDYNGTNPITSLVSGAQSALLLRTAATNTNPSNPSRTLIYTGTGSCDSRNPLYQATIVYFVSNGSLYRRTILPQTAACAVPWQRNSCTSKASNTARCKADDDKLLDGVTSVDIKYYATANSAVEVLPQAANTARVSITLSKQVAGETISYSGAARVTSLNSQLAQTASAPEAPTPNGSIVPSTASSADPYSTRFTWDPIGNSNAYSVEYRIGGSGGWTVVAGTQTGNSYAVPSTGTHRKRQVEIRVTVISNSGNFPYPNGNGGVQSYSIPRWTDCTPQNGWRNYGSVYNNMGFTRTSSGIVGLKGLVTDGQIGNESSKYVCTLPVGFRPTEHIIVQQPAASPSGDRAARVDVFPDGRVQVAITPYGGGGTSSWVSMDGLMFVTSLANPSWTNNSYNSSWYFNNYNDGYGQLKSWKDTLGRTWVQGIATGGSQNAAMSYLPTAHAPDAGLHYPMYSDSAPNSVNFMGAGDNRMLSRASGSYLGTSAVFYASTGGKYPLTLYNSWENYNNGWSTAQCYKGADDIVIVQGLVRNPMYSDGRDGYPVGSTAPCAGGGNAQMSTGLNAILGSVAYPGGAGPDRANRADLLTNGQLVFYGGGSHSAWTSLDGIHYIAD